MYKKMLRSALAVVFSAVAVFGAVSAASGDTGSKQADSGWDRVAVKQPTGPLMAGPADSGWDVAPMKVS